MSNKDHDKYMSYFEDIKSLTTIDIPNQPNSIKGSELKNKIKNFKNIKCETSIENAIKSIILEENDIISRKIFAEIPPRVEYSLTKKGKTLVPVFDMLNDWASDYI